ncbi:MAG TPA: hypothetical protein VEC57_06395 [Candidatus Limnocylindrales bacterium]|nr:hypothetical protein [Candidatus Limnocylindrales bacterium]
MNRTRKAAASLAVALAAVAAASWLQRTGEPEQPSVTTETSAVAVNEGAPAHAQAAAPAASLQNTAEPASIASERELFAYMLDRFGSGIQHSHTQIKAIEKLIALLAELYPEDWQMRLRGVLEQLFPELAAQMYAKYESLMDYNKWLAGKRHELMGMSPQERREALWDMRRELFGEDADVIWEAARKGEQITDALQTISESTDTSVDEKLDTFLGAIDSAYGDQSHEFIARRQTELMNHFLSVDAVQDDLHALSPEERRQELRDLRARMGLDDAALERWDRLDEMRDSAWETGQRYMEERAELLRRGGEQTAALAQLRQRMFGAEAEILASEEAAGFFRFDHRRRFGRE